MAAAHQEITTRPERPASSASPLDRHAPPTASTAKRSGRAMTSLIVGIVSIVAAIIIALAGVVLGIVAIVLGANARSDAQRKGLLGAGQAKAGLICGIAGVVLGVANMIVAVALLA
jgi:hypothetical protein